LELNIVSTEILNTNNTNLNTSSKLKNIENPDYDTYTNKKLISSSK